MQSVVSALLGTILALAALSAFVLPQLVCAQTALAEAPAGRLHTFGGPPPTLGGLRSRGIF
jgi:hypothetical protein